MRIVFWQNCLSPHQLPYIMELGNVCGVDEVVVVAEENIDESRVNSGWIASHNISGISVVLSPDRFIVESILIEEPENTWHLFSGIRGFRFVFNAFRMSLNISTHRGIISERPNTFAFGVNWGKPLWLHKIRYLIQDRKYFSYINAIFAIGEQAESFFFSVCPTWKIVPFMYCTKQVAYVEKERKSGLSICYVGRLSKLKSVETILESITKFDNGFISLSLYGNGPERKSLEIYAKKKKLCNVCFKGVVPNNNIPAVLSNHDVLVLPSSYDGWGAVVNEALQQGLYVICSDACGAKALLKDKKRGSVFRTGSSRDLRLHLQYCLTHLDEIRQSRIERYDWASRHIDGKSIARYMADVLKGNDVIAPWL